MKRKIAQKRKITVSRKKNILPHSIIILASTIGVLIILAVVYASATLFTPQIEASSRFCLPHTNRYLWGDRNGFRYTCTAVPGYRDSNDSCIIGTPIMCIWGRCWLKNQYTSHWCYPR